jgi:hypothetical protein
VPCIELSGKRICEHICEHIKEYYDSSISGASPIFWIILDEIIPNTAVKQQQTSPSGDRCHYNIFNWDRDDQRKLFKKFDLSDFRICANGDGDRVLLRSDIDTTVY